MQCLIEQFKKRGKVVLIAENESDNKKLNQVKTLSNDFNHPKGELHIEFPIKKSDDDIDKEAKYIDP